MGEIKVVAGSEDRHKIPKRVTAFGKWVGTRSTVAPGRQVPAVDDQRAIPTDPFSRKRAELGATTQVAIRIYHLRLPKVRAMPDSPFATEVGAVVAAVAIGLGVHDVAADSYQGWVESSRIEHHWRDVVANLDA